MQDYTGMMNFETIGGTIIEAHLRFADQWCDLYGEGWVEALVKLYAEGHWTFADRTGRTAIPCPCLRVTAIAIRIRRHRVQSEVRAMPKVKSLQITFHEAQAAGGPCHAAGWLPPGRHQRHRP